MIVEVAVEVKASILRAVALSMVEVKLNVMAKDEEEMVSILTTMHVTAKAPVWRNTEPHRFHKHLHRGSEVE